MQDIGTLLVLCVILYVMWWMRQRFGSVRKKQKKVTTDFRRKIESHLQRIQNKPLDRQVIELDKVLDKLLEYLGYQGSLGEMMKVYGPYFLDENAIWSAHKMRNKIVHELDFSPAPNVLRAHIKSFHMEIDALINRG